MSKKNVFGNYLKYHRRQSIDPQRGGLITQERLSELLETVGASISTKTLSNWERGYSHPRRSQRDVVISLISILKRYHGLQTIIEADQLLQSGNYSPLTAAELRKINSTWVKTSSQPKSQPPSLYLLQTSIPKPSPLPAGSRLSIPPNPLFQGREASLRFLAKHFSTTNASPIPALVITGLGGVGKTQLAAEFAHRYGNHFLGGIFWINFDEPNSIDAQIAACGGAGHLDLSPDFDNFPIPKQVALVQQVWQEPPPCLLIFDGCEQEHLLSQWRPLNHSCYVLVTSQRHQWNPTLHVTQLPLDVLPHHDSIALLHQFCPNLTYADADNLAQELSDFPLALYLAGSYLANYQYDIHPADYLAQLHQWHTQKHHLHPSLTEHGLDFSPTYHELDMFRTFNFSYQQLESNNPIDRLAQTLLAHAACLVANEPIPRALLHITTVNYLKQQTPDPTKQMVYFARALTRLTNLGLLTINGNGNIHLHKLLSTFIKSVAPFTIAQKVIEEAVLALLTQHNTVHNMHRSHSWHIHLQHIIDAATDTTSIVVTQLCYQFSLYLFRRGDYKQADIYAQRALNHSQQTSQSDEPTLASIHYLLGIIHEEQGHLETAEKHQQQALNIREQQVGKTHPKTIDALSQLADLYRKKGKYDKSKHTFQYILEIQAQDPNTDPLKIANTLVGLGLLFQETGIYNEAQQYYTKALTIRRQNLPINHANIAQNLNNMGFLSQRLGEYKAASVYLEEALTIRQQIFGDNHPITANSLDKMGRMHQHLGHYTAARPLIEQAMQIRINTLGPEHQDTALSYNNLGNLFIHLKKHKKAQHYLEKALTVHTQTVGRNHIITAFSLNNLGLLFQEIGQYQIAESYLQEALHIRQQALGNTHLLNAYPLHNLGELHLTLGNWKQAQHYLQQAHTLRQAILGEQNPLTAHTQSHLGILAYHQGALDTAYTLLNAAYIVQAEKLGKRHPDTAVTHAYLKRLNK